MKLEEQLDVWATRKEWHTVMLVMGAGAALLREQSPDVLQQLDVDLRGLLARIMKATGDAENYEAWVKAHAFKGLQNDE